MLPVSVSKNVPTWYREAWLTAHLRNCRPIFPHSQSSKPNIHGVLKPVGLPKLPFDPIEYTYRSLPSIFSALEYVAPDLHEVVK
jgi:hypothetical protein